jgi:hypothetical protein
MYLVLGLLVCFQSYFVRNSMVISFNINKAMNRPGQACLPIRFLSVTVIAVHCITDDHVEMEKEREMLITKQEREGLPCPKLKNFSLGWLDATASCAKRKPWKVSGSA